MNDRQVTPEGHLFGVPFHEWLEIKTLLMECRDKPPLESLRDILQSRDYQVQDAREWLTAMNKLRADCDRDLRDAYRAGQANASTDDAPCFDDWMEARKR